MGYCIGCPDVFAFARDYQKYIDDVLQSEQGRKDVLVPRQMDIKELWTLEGGSKGVNPEAMAQMAYSPEWLLLGKDGGERKKEMVTGWRGTMHIDLLEGWQGKGFGRELIERFLGSVRDVVAAGKDEKKKIDVGRGVHIGIAGENAKVVKFYEKVGFRVFEGGEGEGGVWMVRDL